MHLEIIGKNIQVTSALHQAVEKKIGKLDKFLHDQAVIRVVLRIEKRMHVAEITIPLEKKRVLRVEEKQTDMYDAIDRACENIERQLRKHKVKLQKNQRRRETIRFEAVDDTDIPTEEVIVSKVKHFNLKPMSIEEAVLQMDLVGHPFYIFLNEDNQSTSVIYKRNSGDVGLIETK